ncbi:MAG: hypothetical protein ASARMPREDX12_005628 [Alectoria sarmentosa]|nr:MAG: hypothetical protein ASARMPRED_008633 [Alectoria sarmentosa]CAD6573007.1 MAG: hypothetical protein ASARMPREDX12_005628 [Alectoria sarmentosa]
MAHSHYEYSQPESMFPAADPGYQFPGSIPKNESHDYHTAEDTPFQVNYKPYNERQSYPAQNIANTEDGDLGTRSRLTQEQLATLEAEFAERYKPNTEYKKTLAEKMGVEFQKVNNWFQNRRAKAKHQNPQERRYDVSPEQDTHQGSATAFSSTEYEGMRQPYPSENFSSPLQGPVSSADLATSFDFHNLEEMNRQYNANMGSLHDFNNSAILQPDFPNTGGTDPMWSTEPCDILKMPAQTVIERDPFGWPSDSFADASAQMQGQRFAHGNTNAQSQPMYHTAIDGSPVGNPSTQSFVTTSSEGGEYQEFMTPPQGTSPMRSLNQSVFPHRGSDSSDLAANFDTIHIQQSRTGLGGPRGASNAASAAALVSTTGLATPQVSPDAIVSKSPFSPGSSDLAARRRRPRPLALQNDSSRSISYTGPVTSSSHLRASPPGSGKQSPVRRIRSTGNNLNVMTGRVTKSGTTSAQISPRNFESCFQLASLSESQPSASINAHVSQTARAEQSLLTPSSATFAPQAHTAWPNNFSSCSPLASSWEQSMHDNSTPVYAAQHGFCLPPSPPSYQNVGSQIPFEPAHHQQQFPIHWPPQSAPPHLTSFFDPSHPMAADGFNAGWPTPSVTPPEPYRHNQQMPLPMRPNHTLHHRHSGPMNFFAGPHQSFSGSHPSVGPFQPYQPPFQSTPPAPKELDIKIDIGPPVPSQHGQEVKTYTFNHSTPKDFSPGNGKK